MLLFVPFRVGVQLSVIMLGNRVGFFGDLMWCAGCSGLNALEWWGVGWLVRGLLQLFGGSRCLFY